MKKLNLFPDQEFITDIAQAINDGGEYADQLQERFSEYMDYRYILEPLFSRLHNPANQIFTFLITFQYPKKITRTIEIHGKQTFNQLAKSIIESMGWYNDHMHGFALTSVSDRSTFEANRYQWFAPYWDPDPYPCLLTHKVRIYYFDFATHPILNMTFDYGDCHHFEVKLISTHVPKKYEKQPTFPKIISSVGRAIAQYPDRNEHTGEIIDIYQNHFD